MCPGGWAPGNVGPPFVRRGARGEEHPNALDDPAARVVALTPGDLRPDDLARSERLTGEAEERLAQCRRHHQGHQERGQQRDCEPSAHGGTVPPGHEDRQSTRLRRRSASTCGACATVIAPVPSSRPARVPTRATTSRCQW